VLEDLARPLFGRSAGRPVEAQEVRVDVVDAGQCAVIAQ
jgi:hypothetical protein